MDVTMARLSKPLTDTQIRNAKPQPKEYNLSDGGGLHLRMKPAGSKVWIFNYVKPATGKRTNLGLGNYPDLSLAQARETAATYRSQLKNKTDPRENKQLTSRTFQTVGDAWFEIKKQEVSQSYAEDVVNSLALHVYPTLGKLPIEEVSPQKAIAALQPAANANKRETIRRVCQRIDQIMDYFMMNIYSQYVPKSIIIFLIKRFI